LALFCHEFSTSHWCDFRGWLPAQYIDNHQYLKLDYGEVFVERGFCENVIENIENFNEQLSDRILEREIEVTKG